MKTRWFTAFFVCRAKKWKLLKIFFFYLKPLYIGQILWDWALVFRKHPHFFSVKGFCNKKVGSLAALGCSFFGDTTLWGANGGYPLEIFWLTSFLNSLYEKSNTFQPLSHTYSRAISDLLICGSLGQNLVWGQSYFQFQRNKFFHSCQSDFCQGSICPGIIFLHRKTLKLLSKLEQHSKLCILDHL